MPDFKKNNRFQGGRNDFRSGPREMFEAECASCHKMTEVPFRPNGKKPVYCRDCFKPSDDRGERPTFAAPRFEKKSFGPRREFTSSARPDARPDTRIDDLKRQVEAVNVKLDRLVSLLEDSARRTALTEAVKIGTAAPAKPAKKKAAKKASKKSK